MSSSSSILFYKTLEKAARVCPGPHGTLFFEASKKHTLRRRVIRQRSVVFLLFVVAVAAGTTAPPELFVAACSRPCRLSL